MTNRCSDLTDYEYDINGSLREYNLTGLEEFTNYSISILVGNHRGSSSNFTLYQQTKATGKSARIFFIFYFLCYCSYIEPGCCVPRPTTSVSLTTFTATWTEEQCSIRNGLVTNYVIEYGEINTTNSAVGSSVYNIRNFTAKHLFPSTIYVIKVALNNTVGVGPYVTHNITTSTPQGTQSFET